MIKIIKKISNKFFNDFYKIELFRTLISILRFVYFYYIRKKINFYIDPDKKIDDHTLVKNSNSKFSENETGDQTVIAHNMHFVDNFFNLKKTYKKFNGNKTAEIGYPIQSMDFIDYENNKVLSVGPRNEGELFFIKSMGFRWHNIFALDLLSYSPKIQLGDIHKTNYKENTFNVIFCGWVLRYSDNFEKILKEMLRIAKNGAVISIGFTYYSDRFRQLYTTDQIIQFYKENISNVYFNFDAYKKKEEGKRHSIIILKIKK